MSDPKKAVPPFATKNGAPIAPAKTTSGAFNVTDKNRRQEVPTDGATPNTSQNPPHLVQRPQPDGSAAARVDQATLPTGEKGAPKPPPMVSSQPHGTGSIGNAHRGFKVK